MNAVEIELALHNLSQAPFSEKGFALSFLEAMGNTRVSLDRLLRGDTNLSDIGNCILQRKHIHIGVTAPGTVPELLQKMRESPRTVAGRARYILATDGEIVEAEDLPSGEMIACTFSSLADHLGFFLPLAGITPIQEIKENPVDVRATGRLNKLYVELLSANPSWATEDRRHELNQFIARLIFCYFAEDTGIFPGDSLFTSTVMRYSDRDASNTHDVISQLFRAMAIPPKDRAAAALSRWASAFPFVNGGLFTGPSSAPAFTRTARSYLFQAGQLDWKSINPDIFGSMIQAVADDEERGELGMHYTSVPNILKVLNPLFLDDLNASLAKAGQNKSRLGALRRRLSGIRVLDPACGSGNFLVVAYKHLRDIEAEIDRRCGSTGRETAIRLTNFRGIEVKAFSADIARLALIVSEFQCNVLYRGPQAALQFALPLQCDNWITCGNALRLNWGVLWPIQSKAAQGVLGASQQALATSETIEALNAEGETFICGNPPYKGSQRQTSNQKEDLKAVLGHHSRSWGSLDYVAGWYAKAVEYIAGSNAAVGFVSTNSICQGRQVEGLWPHILQAGVAIDFAHSSFRWANLAARNAGVTVVIIGLSARPAVKKRLYSADDGGATTLVRVDNISPYLVPGPNTIVASRRTPLSNIPEMTFGSMPNDGGGLLLALRSAETAVIDHGVPSHYIRPFVGTQELIKGIERRCLWILDSEAASAGAIPWIRSRLDIVREARRSSRRTTTQALSSVPHRFGEVRQRGDECSIIVSGVSSEKRRYLPASVLPPGVIVSNLAFALFNAPLWLLSILSSRLHMVWALAICGQLETRLRYSNTLAWNTFPVPNLLAGATAQMTAAAEDILAARERHFPASLSELYEPDEMPADLIRAHERNDDIVEHVYLGRRFRNDTERLEEMFRLYTGLTSPTSSRPLRPRRTKE